MSRPNVNRLTKLGRKSAHRQRERLAIAYRVALKQLADAAVGRVERHALVAAAEWHMPHPDEIYDQISAALLLHDRTDGIRATAVEAQMGGMLQAFGISFNVSNPLVDGVLRTLGQNITRVAETQRAEIMRVLQQAYDDGLSISNAAAAVSESQAGFIASRSLRIAQTEIVGASNGGSLAAVRITGAAEQKVWLATSDDRVREDHADVDGESVPVNGIFLVGGYPMEYPGDQEGPAEEVVNCRCTLTYE